MKIVNRYYLLCFLFISIISVVFVSCKKEVTPPIATYSVSPASGGVGTPFNFIAIVDSPGSCENCGIYEYQWNFGDDTTWTTSLIKQISYTYTKQGVYPITLRVRNTQGDLSDDYSIDLDVTDTGGGGGTTTGNPPTTPSAKVPLNDASEVTTKPTLQWLSSDIDGDQLIYDVYFGTVSSPPIQISGLRINSFSPGNLLESTFYYWKIIVSDGNGHSVTGPIWTFSTEGDAPLPNRPPNIPTNPYPGTGAQNQTIGKYITWSGSDPDGDNLLYDIYYGKTNPPGLIAENVSDEYYDPGLDIEIGTEYLWKIVAKDGEDETIGPVWSYVTSVDAFYCPSTFTDVRDNTEYNVVQIGNQCWMAQNLQFGDYLESNLPIHNQTNDNAVEFYAYNNNESNADTYGGLYQWNESMNYLTYVEGRGICPDEWHIPSENEWNQLVLFLGGNAYAGERMKEGGDSGFDAMFAGQRKEDGSFGSLGQSAYFWSSNQKDSEKAFEVNINENYAGAYFSFEIKQKGKSIRCIKD